MFRVHLCDLDENINYVYTKRNIKPNYKNLEKLRQLFFERVDNIPDVDKYVDYYKWIDSAISAMVYQLIPGSSRFGERLRNMIESHVLERNKYATKYISYNRS